MRGNYCLTQQPDGQQMTFVLPNTLQPEMEGQRNKLKQNPANMRLFPALDNVVFFDACVLIYPTTSQKSLHHSIGTVPEPPYLRINYH